MFSPQIEIWRLLIVFAIFQMYFQFFISNNYLKKLVTDTVLYIVDALIFYSREI